MKNTINLVVGDWSDVGHGKTEAVTIESNLTTEELKKAYKKATKLLGFDLVEHCCEDYEDNKLSENVISKLESCGIDTTLLLEGDDQISYETWPELYCQVCKLGNPTFEWIFVANDAINIGGYGLFLLK